MEFNLLSKCRYKAHFTDRQILIFILFVVFIILYGKATARIVLGFGGNGSYSYDKLCVKDSNICLPLTYSRSPGIDYTTDSYVYIERGFNMPYFDKNYVKFEDGTYFCLQGVSDGKFNIYAQNEPLENNVKDRVNIYMGRPSDCGLHETN